MKYLLQSWLAICALLFAVGCTKSGEKPGRTLWIYTSLYNHVVQDLDQKLKSKFPDVEIRWYQSGSENVAAKVNSELLGGNTQADLLLTSDPFWYEELKKKGKLLKYTPPTEAKVRAQFLDPDGFYAGVRLPIMVIGYHRDAFSEQEAPKSFNDLLKPTFRDKIAMGSPLESGTAFTSVAVLAKHKGWDYFKKLRENGILVAGGNSAVFGRIETKERPVGIILYENLLAAAAKNPNSRITAVLPSDGVILIPSPVAISATTPHPELAKSVVDFLFSKDAQGAIVSGHMHGLSELSPPLPGAINLSAVLKLAFPWSPEWIQEVYSKRESIKQQFSEIVLD
ncbi:MAG TPA: extracellular solute-binding protein [Oligoflexia bacterium]|nr:extracellular solute-binding protein [Oligoflexia bacterium]